jgi:hypothetical protein
MYDVDMNIPANSIATSEVNFLSKNEQMDIATLHLQSCYKLQILILSE